MPWVARPVGCGPLLRAIPPSIGIATKPFWSPDPDEKPNERAFQAAPQDFSEYIMAASRREYYADDWRTKIQRCPRYVPGMAAADAGRMVQRLSREETEARLSSWRSRLRSNHKELFKWLRQKPAPPAHQVFDDQLGPETEVCKDALQVHASIPQGDVLSPAVMNLILSTPAKVIGQDFPRSLLGFLWTPQFSG